VGVAPGARILSASIFNPTLAGIDPDFDANVLFPLALRWTIVGGARVINNSWGCDVEATDVTAADYPSVSVRGAGVTSSPLAV
jgi:hypothetical protein